MLSLHPREEDVMYTIWEIGHPCVISEILNRNPELKRNTVAKVLKILEQKEYIVVDSIVKTVTRTGRAYTPIIKKECYEEQKTLMKSITENPNIFDGILNYCSTLLDTRKSKITKDFIEEMDRLISEFKKEE